QHQADTGHILLHVGAADAIGLLEAIPEELRPRIALQRLAGCEDFAEWPLGEVNRADLSSDVEIARERSFAIFAVEFGQHAGEVTAAHTPLHGVGVTPGHAAFQDERKLERWVPRV